MTETDVLILGSGVAGLFLAAELAECGLCVCVVESAVQIAPGASTKNEGMLHRGTYHSAAIQDMSAAVNVADRCAYGYRAILERAPGCVVEPALRSFVLIRSPEKVEEYRFRWQNANVPHARIPYAHLRTAVPEINDPSISAAFEVQDKSIDVRVLYKELFRHATRQGVRFLTSTEVTSISTRDGSAILNRHGCAREQISASIFLYAVGNALPELLRSLLSLHVNVRLWKSHLLDLPRASTHNLFFIERDGFTLMSHRAWSIAGLNADARQVDVASLEPTEDQVTLLKERVARTLPGADVARAVGRACLKVDCDTVSTPSAVTNHSGALSLDAVFREPIPGHIWVLPGKMTEAPYVASVLSREICGRLRSTRNAERSTSSQEVRVAPRPIDLRTPVSYPVPVET